MPRPLRLPLALVAAGLAVLALAAWPAPRAGAQQPPATATAACPTTAGAIDVTRASVPELRAALDAGTVTSRQLVETYLARIAAVNRSGPDLRAVILTAPDALAQADAADAARAEGRPQGPLAGIPVLLKDNLDTHDMATTAGAKAMLGAPPPTDATVTAKLRAAGAVILGKANMSEWATSISKRAGLSFSDVGGRLHNPYDGGETSGSSNGSAIAASASLAALTVGTETQGSVVLPSFLNSAVGIKPTMGLVSRGGVVPLLPAFDQPGPITRSVTDAALLLSLMTGIDPRDPVTRRQRGHVPAEGYEAFLRTGALRGARIGLAPTLARDPMARIVGQRRLIATLRRAGATIVPIRSKLWVGTAPGSAIYGEFKRAVNRYLRERGPTSPRHSLAEVIAYNRQHGREAVRYGQTFLLRAQAAGRRAQRTAGRRLAAYVDASSRAIDRAMDRHRLDAILSPRLVAAVTATSGGHPHVTVPAGYAGRTPYGLVLVGRKWSEPKLVGYAYDFEQATRAWRSPADLNPAFAAVCAAG
ncbi:MAG TPA: amidase family protein [Capillimicrobium sp.]|nr:amidase family protein [Capillimicrobium sp.]